MSELQAILARRRAMESGERWASAISFANQIQFWLGAGRDAENLCELRKHGITHILNVADGVCCPISKPESGVAA